MARTGITQTEVAEAIDTLVDAGIDDPSIRMIHQKLGSGSLSTIIRHKRAIEQARRDESGEGLPDPVISTLTEIAEQLWRELGEAADTRIVAVDNAARQRIADAENLADDARASLTTIQHQLSESQQAIRVRDDQLEDRQQEVSTLQQSLSDERAQNAALQEKINGKDSLIDELRLRTEEQTDRLRELTDRLRDSESTQQQLLASLGEREQKLIVLQEQQAAAMQSLQQACLDAEQQVSALRTENEHLVDARKAAESRYDELLPRIDEMQQENSSLMQRLGSLQSDKKTLETQVSQLRREISDKANRQSSDLETRLEKLENALSRKKEDRK